MTGGGGRAAPRATAAVIARALVLLGLLPIARAGWAQDFQSPWSAAEPAAATLLEHGLPRAAPGTALEFLGGRWLGLAGLETRALALATGWRSARLAAGLSSTGDADLGWTTAALAAGVGEERAGAALRTAGRRDRAPRAGGGREQGIEAGAGAWLSAGPVLRVWASSPQLWVDGAAPPLSRGFVVGAALSGADLFGWIARESVRLGRGDDLHASHAAALGWSGAGLTLAFEARDQPLRGAVAVAAAAGPVAIAARLEGHPVAGETTHLALRWGTR